MGAPTAAYAPGATHRPIPTGASSLRPQPRSGRRRGERAGARSPAAVSRPLAGGAFIAGAAASSASNWRMRFCTLSRRAGAVCDFMFARVSRRSRNCFCFSASERRMGWLSDICPWNARMMIIHSNGKQDVCCSGLGRTNARPHTHEKDVPVMGHGGDGPVRINQMARTCARARCYVAVMSASASHSA